MRAWGVGGSALPASDPVPPGRERPRNRLRGFAACAGNSAARMPEMPTTLDCELFRDVFGSAEMRRVFDTRSMLQSWLDAEAALAAAEADAGVIPKTAADRILQESDAQ